MKTEITAHPNPILSKTTELVSAKEIADGKWNKTIEIMKKAMVDNSGVGLAANQIGLDVSLFVIDANVAKEYNVSEAFFNPEITEYSKEQDVMEEGCLSIKGLYTMIKRPKKIMFKALDSSGKKVKFRARRFLARVLQHETDHLNGLVIKDRM